MTEPQSPFVYVDANPFIYFVESDDSLAASVRDLFAVFHARPGLAVTSELTLAEVLPKAAVPFRRAYFDLIVWSKTFDLRPVTRDGGMKVPSGFRVVDPTDTAAVSDLLREVP